MNQPPAAPRRQRRASARPDEILDAALDVFIAKGFDAARMDDIAAAAGISKPGVYLYFDSKPAVLRALILREISPVAARLAAAIDAGMEHPEATLRVVMTTALTLLADPRKVAIPRLVIAISNRFPDLVAFYRGEIIDRAVTALTALIEAGKRQGAFREVDASAAVRALVGPLLFYAIRRHVFDGETDEDAATIARHQLDIALKGLSRRTP